MRIGHQHYVVEMQKSETDLKYRQTAEYLHTSFNRRDRQGARAMGRGPGFRERGRGGGARTPLKGCTSLLFFFCGHNISLGDAG